MLGGPLMGGSRASSLVDSPPVGGSTLGGVPSTLAIGDFSRATHLSVKMLRHYHEIGLLEPVAVDAETGYRRYGPDQIATAQIIRRFRDLDMPLDEIQEVLTAPDVETRNQLISGHLARLETSLARTGEAVSSLRNLLDHPATKAPVQHRYVPVTPAAAITDTVEEGSASCRPRLRPRGSFQRARLEGSSRTICSSTAEARPRSSCPVTLPLGSWAGSRR